MLKKQKVHLMLHLVECMNHFGPTSAFNSERCVGNSNTFLINIVCYRCETFNSFIRVQNIFGNKGAPSRDIAYHFSVIEHLRYICDGGSDTKGRR